METVTATNYCRVCGTCVNGTLCENCGCNPYAGNAYCNNCGETTLPQALMCPKCKNYFPSPNTTPYVDNYEDLGVNSKSNVGKWVIGILIIACVVGGIIYSNSANQKVVEEPEQTDWPTFTTAKPTETNESQSTSNPYIEQLLTEVRSLVEADRNVVAEHSNEHNDAELQEMLAHQDRLNKIRFKLIDVKKAAVEANYDMAEIHQLVAENEMRLAALQMGIPALERMVEQQKKGNIVN